MVCPNCGYENNLDDALSCNLCGKVFRKEVREDKEEQDKQSLSKKERFYAEMKKKVWEKDNKNLPDIIVGAKGVYEMIKGLLTSKGEERIEWMLGLFALVIAIVIGVVLDQKFGLREAWYVPGKGYGLWILFIGAMWIFIYVLFSTLLSKFTKKRKK